MGNKYVPNFAGVFPLDRLPKSLRAPANFIVNTHTHNLPGEHWIAVSYQKGELCMRLTLLEFTIHICYVDILIDYLIELVECIIII